MGPRQYVALRISNDAEAVPTVSDIAEGELAINVASERVYLRFGDVIRDITDRYTRAEIDDALSQKASAAHTHTLNQITDAGSAASAERGDFEPYGAAQRALQEARQYVDSRPDPLLMHFI